MNANARPATYLPIQIADGVRASALRNPEKIALQEGEHAITYARLVERIDRVSTGVTHGFEIAAGAHSAIMSPNCIEFVEIAFGLASCGVPPAMVNPHCTTEELSFICNDSEARVLFVHPSLEELARSTELESVERIVVIGPEYEHWLAEARAVAPSTGLEEWDVFCIPYTAGTTGRPKGVLLSHRSRVLTFFGMASEYGCFGPDDRTLAVAPLYHGGGFTFAVAPIFFGGYCAILSKFDPERALRALADLRITNTWMVPTHFQALFELEDGTLRRHHPTELSTIIANAAPLSQVMKERIVAYFGETVLFEAYGSTEAAIVSNLRPADQLTKQHSVGRPFPCTEVRLRDPDGKEVAPGEVGELFSRSPYLFNGYWKRPEDTEASMREGWFSAGDLARRDDEGYLYIVDRKDDMIISGGINIYPREVEEALLRHPSVAEAAVFGVPDDRWGEAVHAAVALKPGNEASADTLIEFCGEHLARYKLPKEIEFVPRVPRNVAGKILRRDLRKASPAPD